MIAEDKDFKKAMSRGKTLLQKSFSSGPSFRKLLYDAEKS